ncbi:MAG: sodium:calcium antiporter [Flavobacteriaceae bacterium]|nr:sodium:calcium antiporter [Flavobacteriaceae bacterium]
MGLIIPILIIVFCCIVIWKASDGFETSSEYLGRNMSEGVRGATINAISSSMPELFTTIFFLWFLKDTDGFSGGIGTTAGSAIFNGMIIPAVVIFAVLSSNASTKIEVSKKVILRDGLSLIIAEAILILLISGDTLTWWHGLVLMLTYGAYITYMLTSMKKVDNEDDDDEDDEDEIESIGFFKGLFTLNLEGLVIGNKEINTRNSWQLLILSMLIIGSACLLLVVACEFIGSDTYTFLGYEFNGLNIPIMFVAVILASAATSVPDTIISIRDAKNGNYNDAVANALGSNIFDICFALGFPLFLYCLIYGPINMDPTVVEFSSELRILLLVFTILAFFVYYIGKYMDKIKAFILLSMYILFTAYICGRSLDASWAQEISDVLRNIANLIA